MIHDPLAAKAILLHLGCPEHEVDRVFGRIAHLEVPSGFTDLLHALRMAMHACGVTPEPR